MTDPPGPRHAGAGRPRPAAGGCSGGAPRPSVVDQYSCTICHVPWSMASLALVIARTEEYRRMHGRACPCHSRGDGYWDSPARRPSSRARAR
ncbi:MAG: hypothetical protein GEV09_25150 [Pseudonocardiaceae bacterium]|nr:hypothetical protein [Pseudonocardiaceae bacterium]